MSHAKLTDEAREKLFQAYTEHVGVPSEKEKEVLGMIGRVSLFAEINKERVYQDEKWGTKFDDKNTINDWVSFLNIYTGPATRQGLSVDAQRTQLLKALTILVAAVETLDRNGKFAARHYELQPEQEITVDTA